MSSGLQAAEVANLSGFTEPPMEEIRRFQSIVMCWASQGNLRHLPWREGRPSAYAVLVAEVLLKRTTAKQVAAVYPEFLRIFPCASDLANASLARVKSMISPLGLPSRANHLIQIARAMTSHPEVLTNKEALEALPGVGPYVAGATQCFAWGKAEALIDTNTVRLVGRFFGYPYDESSHRDRVFRQLLERVLLEDDPIVFNRAMLDLAAGLCHSRKPECRSCPLRPHCHYARSMESRDDRALGSR